MATERKESNGKAQRDPTAESNGGGSRHPYTHEDR